MAQLFTLSLTDNTETASFVRDKTYKVADGGFDIGMPASVREITEIRPSFFRLAKNQKQYRQSTIEFAIHGSTRNAVLLSLAKLERIITSIEDQEWITDDTKGQLSYAFEGADYMTYFEVYAAELEMPSNMLSVEVAHAQDGAGFYIHGLTLRLYLSPSGYGLSLYSEPTFEVPLYNPTVASKQTGGVNIKNPGDSNYSYVQIDGSDIQGALPYITKLQLIGESSGYSSWANIFIGKQHTPYPAQIVYDDATIAGGLSPGTVTANPAANGGQYRTKTYTGSYYGLFADFAWSVPSGVRGMFLPFMVGYTSIGTSVQFSFGIDDYVKYGIRSVPEYTQLAASNIEHFAMAPVQLPPVGVDIEDYGTLHEDLWMGCFIRADGATSFTWDYVHLLPISNGLRVWTQRRDPGATVECVDNHWKGIEYNRDPATGKVWSGFYTMMSPLTLSPGKSQRLYFSLAGYSGSVAERTREFEVRLWAVPAFSTLAY